MGFRPPRCYHDQHMRSHRLAPPASHAPPPPNVSHTPPALHAPPASHVFKPPIRQDVLKQGIQQAHQQQPSSSQFL